MPNSDTSFFTDVVSSSPNTPSSSSSAASSDPFAPVTAATETPDSPATGEPNPNQPAALPELPEIPINPPATSEPAPAATPSAEPFAAPTPTAAAEPIFTAQQHTFPNLEVMLAELDESGVLLPELETQAVKNLDQSPLAALQPGQLTPESTFFSAPLTTPTPKVAAPALAGSSEDGEFNLGKMLMSMGVMVFASLLAVQVIQHLVQLLHFVMITYPQLQDQIMFQQASPSIVNHYGGKAVLLFALSIVSLIGSLFLLFNREHPQLKILLSVAAVMIGLNFATEQFLVKPQFHFANPAGFAELRKVLTAPTLDANFTTSESPTASPVNDIAPGDVVPAPN